MSVSFSGTLKRSGGIGSAIAKQLRLINLEPVKKIEVKFDPFKKNVTETRYVRETINFDVITSCCAFVFV